MARARQKKPVVIREMFARERPSLEDQYFYEADRRLIDRRKRQENALRAGREAIEDRKSHAVRCPSCGERIDLEVHVASTADVERAARRGLMRRIVRAFLKADIDWKP